MDKLKEVGLHSPPSNGHQLQHAALRYQELASHWAWQDYQRRLIQAIELIKRDILDGPRKKDEIDLSDAKRTTLYALETILRYPSKVAEDWKRVEDEVRKLRELAEQKQKSGLYGQDRLHQ